MDLDGVRTFLLAADLGRMQSAADELGLTPQAVSKRVTALEQTVGAALFSRGAHGVRLTREGRTFLPHARELVRAADRAWDSVQPHRRALRIDVTHRRIAPSVIVQDFHQANPGLDIDVVTLPDNSLRGALAAVRAGVVDASFRAVTVPAEDLPKGVGAVRAIDHELELLVGPRHPLAGRTTVAPAQLGGHRIWIPGIVPGTEWATFYEDFAAAFDLTVDGRGPHFGDEALLEQLTAASDLATLIGKRDRYLWPAHYDLRRIPLRGPTPLYPHSLIWLSANPHPALAALRDYLATLRRRQPPGQNIWLPGWAADDHLEG